MADLSVKIAGMNFKNPIMIASLAGVGPWTHWPPEKDAPEIQMKVWRRFYEGGVGAIVTGSIYPKDLTNTRGSTRFYAVRTKGFAEREGFISGATIPDSTFSHTNGLELIRRAKKEFTDTRIIANIICEGADTKAWGKLALECQQAGADMVELNCASIMFFDSVELARNAIEVKEKLPPGATMGLVPEVVSAVVKGIHRVTDIPVAVKLTPEMSFFHLLKAIPMYEEAGVAALTSHHTFMTVTPPDIYNQGKTTFPHMDKTTFWSTNGPWHRFACYRNVAMIGKYFPKMNVMACGGLVTPEQCIEVMMLGAKTVQLSAAIMWNGLRFPGRVVKFLETYVEEQGYKSVNDFIGLGQKYIVEMEECQAAFKEQIGKLIAHIDYDKCAGLSSCKVCLDNFCYATYAEGDQPKVDPEMCDSCNLCVIRCPQGARYLAER